MMMVTDGCVGLLLVVTVVPLLLGTALLSLKARQQRRLPINALAPPRSHTFLFLPSVLLTSRSGVCIGLTRQTDFPFKG
jgi:hypothetical protein